MTTAARNRYSAVAIVFHWLIAGLIVLQLIIALRMEGKSPEAFAFAQLHKSVGLTILALSLGRLGWRLLNPPPPMPPGLARWERLLAKATHVAFYGVMIGMPLTGWIMVSTSRLSLPTLLYGRVPWPHIPFLASLAAPAKHLWSMVGQVSHVGLAIGFLILIPLHIGGALKHQLFDKEPVLERMAPGAKPGRWLESRLFAIAAWFLAIIAAGFLMSPPDPGVSQPQPKAPPPPPMTAAPPSAIPDAIAWTVSPGSTIDFSTTWGGQPVHGRFKQWTAQINFSPDNLDQSKVVVEINPGTVATGEVMRDATLPSETWFDAIRHPTAIYSADRFERTGADTYVAHGKLTLRGITKPVDLPFQLRFSAANARMTAKTELDRLTFGIGQGEWKATTQIPDKVSVTIDLRAHRS
ncbi:YceI family protein [soil metagenome]